MTVHDGAMKKNRSQGDIFRMQPGIVCVVFMVSFQNSGHQVPQGPEPCSGPGCGRNREADRITGNFHHRGLLDFYQQHPLCLRNAVWVFPEYRGPEDPALPGVQWFLYVFSLRQ